MTATEAHPMLLGAIMVLVTAFPGPVPAQEPGGGDQEADQETMVISLGPEGLTLSELIEMAERDTGRTFLYGDEGGQVRELQQKKVHIVGVHEVPADEIYQFYQSVFRSQGYAMVPMGPEAGEVVLVEPIANSRLLKTAAKYVDSENLGEWQRRAGEVILTSIQLEHVTVAHVRQAVQNIIQSRTAEFIHEVQSANALIVMGFAPTVYAIKQLVDAMDRPVVGATLEFDIIELENAVAEEMQPMLQDLIADSAGGGGGQQAALRRAQQQGQPPQLPGQEAPEPKIIADLRTNSLVVYAIPPDMAQIRKLVKRLDREVSEIESNVHVYFLRNHNADDMATVIREVMTGQETTRSTRPGGAGGIQGRGGTGPVTSGARGAEVNIVPDPATNALIITATKTRYREIRELISKLDTRRPQVLVQAAIAELSDTDLLSIASELTAIEGGDDTYRFAGATSFGLSSITTSVVPDGGNGGGGGTGTGTGGGAAGGGLGGGNGDPFSGLARVPFASEGGISFSGLAAGIFEENLNVPLLVSLLKSTTKGNLVSVPSVLTNDNESSHIRVSRQVPTVDFQTSAAGTDNRSFGGFEEAQLLLSITPHISNDTYLRLDIELLVEAFMGATDVFSGVPPPKTTREFLGSVTVPNGRTVVIGGLVQDNYQTSVDSVPLLGDIPVLGYLFKSTSTSTEKTTLYLFVTPTIFTGFQELQDISYQKKLEVAKLEGNVKLIDPDFRPVELDDDRMSLEQIESSGHLDVPRYAPLTPIGEQVEETEVEGVPVKPARIPGDTEADLPQGSYSIGGSRAGGKDKER